MRRLAARKLMADIMVVKERKHTVKTDKRG
jgi:hypothetical protein